MCNKYCFSVWNTEFSSKVFVCNALLHYTVIGSGYNSVSNYAQCVNE